MDSDSSYMMDSDDESAELQAQLIQAVAASSNQSSQISQSVSEDIDPQPLSSSRWERMADDLKLILRSADSQQGRIICRESKSDTSKWVVGLRRFAEDCENGQDVSWRGRPRFDTSMHVTFSSQLDHDLRVHAASHIGTSGAIELEVVFPETFPQTAPIIRLVRPVLDPHSGGCDMGALALPVLFPEGWSTHFTMLQMLRWVRVHLCAAQPRLRWSCAGHYPRTAFEQARQRLENRESMLKISSMMTEKAYIAMSRTNATALGLMNHFPAQFEVADKVELPGHILDQLTEDGTTGSQALTFEVRAPTGVKVYCGANFSSPEPNLVILPDWLWSCLACPECIEVKLTPVELPRALSINLNALSHKFAALSIDHNMVLQAALQNYTTLQAGMTIPVRVFEDVYHFQIAATTPMAPAVCPWLGSYWTDLGIKFGPPLVEDTDTPAPLPHGSGVGGASGSSIPAAPRLTHQLSAGSVSSPGASGMPAPLPLGPRMPSYMSSHEASTPGGAGGLEEQQSAAQVAAQADRERAAFQQWRRQQDSTEDAVALSAAAGQRVQGFDASQPGGKVKVDLFNPLNNPSIPPQVTILMNHSTTLAQLYEHIVEHFAPRHVPFDLFVRGRAPVALGAALAAAAESAQNERHVPDTAAVSVQDAQLLGKVLEAQLRPKRDCDKLQELLAAAQQEADGPPHLLEHSEAQRAMTALERGEDFGEVSTYVINGGTLGLCERFDCDWLKQLQRSDVPGLQLGADDLTLLKKDVILGNLQAELI